MIIFQLGLKEVQDRGYSSHISEKENSPTLIKELVQGHILFHWKIEQEHSSFCHTLLLKQYLGREYRCLGGQPALGTEAGVNSIQRK